MELTSGEVARGGGCGQNKTVLAKALKDWKDRKRERDLDWDNNLDGLLEYTKETRTVLKQKPVTIIIMKALKTKHNSEPKKIIENKLLKTAVDIL